jgi:predicted transglutaminase-like cysteine proteinase
MSIRIPTGTLRAMALVLVLATGALLSGSQANAADQATFMPLGSASAAPLGFLKFCARMPEQCGLPVQAGSDMDVDAISRALIAKYYWAVMFPASVGAGSADARISRSDTTQTSSADGGDRASRDDGIDLAIASDGSAILVEEQARPVRPMPATRELVAWLDQVNHEINRAIRYQSERTLSGDADNWRLPLLSGPRAGDCKDYVLEKRRALIEGGLSAANLSIAIVVTPRGEPHAILLVTTDQGELVLDSLSDWVRPWRKVNYRWISRQAPGHQLQWISLTPPEQGI